MSHQGTPKQNPRIDVRDPFLFSDIKNKKYGDLCCSATIEKIVEDMERLLVFTAEPLIFYLKSKSINDIIVAVRSYEQAMKVLKNVVIVGKRELTIPTGKKSVRKVCSPINLEMIFKGDEDLCIEPYSNYFQVASVRFLSDDPNDFSLFRGYPHAPLKTYDMNIIGPFLKHVHEVIANGNLDHFTYILNWISFIVQNPGKKNTRALLIIGDKGTGK